MTKTLNQIICFSPPKSEYFIRKKHTPPPHPFKLNGRSLTKVKVDRLKNVLQADSDAKVQFEYKHRYTDSRWHQIYRR